MLIDLGKYDLLSLIGGGGWTEEKQRETVLKFSTALSGYMSKKLADYFTEEDEAEFKQLLLQPSLTPQRVLEFYRQKIPRMEETVDTYLLEFKKMFLLKVYAQRKNKLQKEAENPGLSAEQRTLINKQAKIWQEILYAGTQDNWDKLYKLLRRSRDPHLIGS